MLKSPIDIEEENEDGRTTNLVVHPTTENALVEVKEEELDQNTAEALRLRYRLFNDKDNVRWTMDDNKNVWFVADDVVKILGYSKDTAAVIKQHCNKVYDTKDLEDGKELAKKIVVKDSVGRQQNMIAISEPDLYRLIMRSHMPEARSFEKWVVEDVLPSIRKTGKYKVSRKIDYKPAEPAQVEASEGVEPVQLELFPCNLQSVSFPRPLTDKINAAKKRLYDQGHTFPNNKEFVKFLVTKALETLED